MTTVINNPGSSEDGAGSALIVGIVLIIGLVLLLLYFGLPIIRGSGPADQPGVTTPHQIDVNVTQPK